MFKIKFFTDDSKDEIKKCDEVGRMLYNTTILNIIGLREGRDFCARIRERMGPLIDKKLRRFDVGYVSYSKINKDEIVGFVLLEFSNTGLEMNITSIVAESEKIYKSLLENAIKYSYGSEIYTISTAIHMHQSFLDIYVNKYNFKILSIQVDEKKIPIYYKVELCMKDFDENFLNV